MKDLKSIDSRVLRDTYLGMKDELKGFEKREMIGIQKVKGRSICKVLEEHKQMINGPITEVIKEYRKVIAEIEVELEERGIFEVMSVDLNSLDLRGHKCREIARVPNYQPDHGDGVWWFIGELTEKIPGHERETHCIHIKTPLKPEIVFGVNVTDAGPYAVIGQILYSGPVNPHWVDRQERRYRKNSRKDR